MSDDRALNLVYLVGFLMLVLSALSLRRFSLGLLVRSVLSWLVIGALIYIGVAHRYELQAGFGKIAAALGLDEQSVEGDTVRIRQSPDGHFWAQVMLNGVRRRMLIDSGATFTSLSQATADAAGVDTRGAAFPVMVDTANGTITAKRGSVQHLELGGLRAEDIDVLVSPSFGSLDVLGMNFLSQLGSWRVEGHTLVLEPPKKEQKRDRT
jgi:aspartyl protease family protein